MSTIETKYAKAYHLAGAIGAAIGGLFPFCNILLPVIVWAIYGDGSKFSRHHGWQAVRFQLILSVYWIALGLIAFVGFGASFFGGFALSAIFDNPAGLIGGMSISALLLMFTLVVTASLYAFGVIAPIFGMNRASNGEFWNYPFVFARGQSPAAA